jgi:hypothetical protein
MTKPTRPWYEDLTDSVTALREAAYEHKVAQRSAKSLRDSVQFERRRIEEGRIHALPMPNARGGSGWASQPHSRDPHSNAIFELHGAYSRLLGAVSSAFEHASMLFASGAAWAITQVQKGNTPDRVAFERDPQDTDQLVPRSFEIVGLDRYSGAPALAFAHADGTGPAAYAYGLLGESALRFALLPIRHGRPTVPEQPGPVDTE